jgi:hypothetical protein
MKNQKIRMLVPRADRHVVPAHVVVFEMGFQPPREATFAGGHPAYYARKDADEVRHAKYGVLAEMRK